MLTLSDELLLLLSDQSLNFTSIREILEKISNHKNRKVIWSTLARLIKNGFLKKNQTKRGSEFHLTTRGRKEVPKEPVFISRPEYSWDKKWRVVFFDIPETKRKIRDKFAVKLKEMGFGRIKNSVYISVHDISQKVGDLARTSGVPEEVKIMIVEDINEPDEKKFAGKIWNLKELNQKYSQFVKKYKNGYAGKEFASEILRYWLKKTKYEYLNILHQDPILPKELLPSDWQGYEAQKLWENLAAILETY